MKLLAILLPLFVVGYFFSGASAADTGTSSVSVVPESPVSATCTFADGKTVVRIVALDSVSDVHLSLSDGRRVDVVSTLSKDWSVVRTVPGAYQSVLVEYSWRGSAGRVPVPCS